VAPLQTLASEPFDRFEMEWGDEPRPTLARERPRASGAYGSTTTASWLHDGFAIVTSCCPRRSVGHVEKMPKVPFKRPVN
jgi:hypothetical protein